MMAVASLASVTLFQPCGASQIARAGPVYLLSGKIQLADFIFIISNHHRPIMQRTILLKYAFQQSLGYFSFHQLAAVLVKLLVVIFGEKL